MSKPLIRYGFLIKNGEIYDTKIQSYKICKKVLGTNIVYYLETDGYKRLYLFEVLLMVYDTDKVFEILKFNKHLRSVRNDGKSVLEDKIDYASNISVIYNYPVKYLTNKKFSLYKVCQRIKSNLD